MDSLIIMCDACRRPIADGDGYLHVDHGQITQHISAQAARANAPVDDLSALTPAAILTAPGVARWQAHHHGCYPDAESVDYDVPVDQVRTWPLLTEATARLMAKTWISSTDWAVLLEDATSGRGRVRAIAERTRNA